MLGKLYPHKPAFLPKRGFRAGGMNGGEALQAQSSLHDQLRVQ